MRKFLLLLLIAFSLTGLALTSFAQPPKKVLNIQHWKTSSGTKVYFVYAPNLPIFDLRVIFTAGSAYDKQQFGLASLTNSMIGESTKQQNAKQIANAFDTIGAKFSHSINRDMAMVSLRTLTKPHYLATAISEFTNVLSQINFPNHVLQRLKNRAMAIVKVKQQMPGELAAQTFYHVVYGKQPYGHDPVGNINTIKQLTNTDCLRFYRRYYVTHNADIVLVGNISLKQAKQISRRVAHALPTGPATPRLNLAKPIRAQNKHIPFPAKQTTILIGQLGIARNNPDYFPLTVGNFAFGGLPLGSILFEQVRNKKGLAYSARSAFQTLRYRGPFIISLKTRANKTKEALKLVESTIDSFVKKGPALKQLDAAKQNLIGRFPLGIASNSQLAGIVSIMAFYQLPLNYLDTYQQRVQAVTPEQVTSDFQKHLNSKQFVVITVGPKQIKAVKRKPSET